MYLDHAATTPIRQEILDSYYQLLQDKYANPSSIHRLGQESANILLKAREQIARFFHREAEEIIFTSGATEANNLAIKGYALRYKNRGRHLITSVVEHPSVLEAFKQLEQNGYRVTYLPVDHQGMIRLEDLKKAIDDETILVSIMAVNNEVGAINDLQGIAQIVHQYPKAVFHSDTTQAIGKIELPYDQIDMFVLSAHKLYGLKGSGALIKNKRIDLLPLASGGGQEYGYRSGTNDFPKEVMLAKTIRLLFANYEAERKHVENLFKMTYDALKDLDEITLNSGFNGSPFILNFSLKTKKASVVVEALSNLNIMVSTLSACSSKKTAYSSVLYAMGKDKHEYSNSIRLSFGKDNTVEEITFFIENLKRIIQEIK